MRFDEHTDIDGWITSHKHNVTLGVTGELCISQFQEQLMLRHGEYTGFDLGAVMFYVREGHMTAWVDYELGVGYIAD